MSDDSQIQRNNSSSSKKNCLKCFKACIAFSFSHVGLTVLTIAYITFGGWMFEALELPNEIRTRADMNKIVNDTIDKLFNEALLMHTKTNYKMNYTFKNNLIISDFENTLISKVKAGYTGNENFDEREWTFFRAILYATTLISTIGYGHITCKTSAGKVATIIFSVVGIPLMTIFSANIGSSMAKSFRFIFSITIKRFKRKKKMKDDQGRSKKNSKIRNNERLLSPNSRSKSITNCKADGSMITDGKKFRKENRRCTELSGTSKSQYDNFPTQKRQSKTTRESQCRIPIPFAVAIFFFYIVGGALLFDAWEEDWTFVNSFYFCFITLTTIGFGDFVPGVALSKSSTHKFIIATCYIFVGFVIIAMCLDLVKERIIGSFKRCKEGDSL